MEEQNCNQLNEQNHEVSLFELIQKVWKNRFLLIKITAVFTLVGIIVSLFTPNIYNASCTLVPQTGQKTTASSLGGLAAIAGINLGNINSNEILSPSVYPKILTNYDFQRELIHSKFHFQGINEPLSLYEYYSNDKYKKFNLISTIKKYTIGLPSLIKNITTSNDDNSQKDNLPTVMSLSNIEKNIVKKFKKNILLSVNGKDGYITISANMPEPILAAEMVQKVQELLQKYLTKFKLEKVARNLSFVERSFEEGKRNFELKQIELAKFRDANKNFSSAVAKTHEEKLISEYTLLLGIYSELAKQKEQAKIAITETTPILTVIEPVYVPLDKSKPNRLMTTLMFTFVGLISSFVAILLLSSVHTNLYIKNNLSWIEKIIN